MSLTFNTIVELLCAIDPKDKSKAANPGVYVITGPAAAGKSSLAGELIKQGATLAFIGEPVLYSAPSDPESVNQVISDFMDSIGRPLYTRKRGENFDAAIAIESDVTRTVQPTPHKEAKIPVLVIDSLSCFGDSNKGASDVGAVSSSAITDAFTSLQAVAIALEIVIIGIFNFRRSKVDADSELLATYGNMIGGVTSGVFVINRSTGGNSLIFSVSIRPDHRRFTQIVHSPERNIRKLFLLPY